MTDNKKEYFARLNGVVELKSIGVHGSFREAEMHAYKEYGSAVEWIYDEDSLNPTVAEGTYDELSQVGESLPELVSMRNARQFSNVVFYAFTHALKGDDESLEVFIPFAKANAEYLDNTIKRKMIKETTRAIDLGTAGSPSTDVPRWEDLVDFLERSLSQS